MAAAGRGTASDLELILKINIDVHEDPEHHMLKRVTEAAPGDVADAAPAAG
jgi:hypothetical protein